MRGPGAVRAPIRDSGRFGRCSDAIPNTSVKPREVFRIWGGVIHDSGTQKGGPCSKRDSSPGFLLLESNPTNLPARLHLGPWGIK